MRRANPGFSLIEVLIALAVIGIGIAALTMSQVTNLRASVTARTATETKVAANRVLERVMALVLERDGTNFNFNDYYWTCPSIVPPSAGSLAVRGWSTSVCAGTADSGNPDVTVAFAIRGEPGILGEGVVSITITATHVHTGQRLTLGDRITCYDVYPTPTATTPAPCPLPTEAGSGRP